MDSAPFDLRAHDSVFDRLDDLAQAPITEELWTTILAVLRQVMQSPDTCRLQGIRWPGSQVSGYRMSAWSSTYEVQVWWSFVDGESFVWGLTFDPELNG